MDEYKTSYKLPVLPYELDALQPVISKEALEIHYKKHHQAYVNNLNIALDKYHEAERKNDISEMTNLQSSIKFNGGGYINHKLFWDNLAPISSNKSESKGEIEVVINSNFGSFEALKEEFNKKALAVQGSGWAWIGYNKSFKTLEIVTTKNHETISSLGLIPIMIVDVWEHAYYLQYKNERNTFLKNIWQIINFEEIEKRYKKAIE